MRLCVGHGVHVEVRGQFWGVVSHLPPYCFRATLVSAMQCTPGYLVPRTPADSTVSAYYLPVGVLGS